MKLILLPGGFDAVAEQGAGFGNSVELHQKLCAAEKRMDVRRLIGDETLKESEAFLGAILVVVLARQAIAEELILRLILEHRFDFFAARWHGS